MKNVFLALFALIDLSIIKDVADVLQQGGLAVPTTEKEALKTLFGLIVWLVLEYSRRRSAAKTAKNEAVKAVQSLTPSPDEESTAAAAGRPGGFGPGVDPSTVPIAEDGSI